MGFGQYSYDSRGRNNPLAHESWQNAPKKQVFPTGEIPHLWFHKTQSMARNPHGNLFFKNETIFSYGEHFPIASHVTGADGTPAVLINNKRYSVTTSSQQWAVRAAIPNSVKKFFVPMEFKYGEVHLGEVLTLMSWDVNSALDKVGMAKNKVSRAKRYSEYRKLRESLIEFVEFFNLSRTSILPLYTSEQLEADYADRRKHERDEERLAAARRKEEQRLRELNDADKIEAWKNGAKIYFPRTEKTMLRVMAGYVETSMGAQFPISHAKRGLALVRSVVARGEEWRTNGHTCHLGPYKIDRITADGTVYAGCHVVEWQAIERIADQIESYEGSETNAA